MVFLHVQHEKSHWMEEKLKHMGGLVNIPYCILEIDSRFTGKNNTNTKERDTLRIFTAKNRIKWS